MDTPISVDAHPRYLITTDAAAFSAASILLLIVSRIPAFLSPLAVAILITSLALGFGFDVLLWYLKGIRSVELDSETLTVYRGHLLSMQRISRDTVTSVRLRSRLWRRGAVVSFGEKRKLSIMEDAFPKEQFERLLTALADWR